MDQSLEVTNMKSELTDSTSADRLEVPNEMPINSIKQESRCLIQSDVYIKTEPQEDESGFPVTAGTSYSVCPSDDIKSEMYEPIIRIKTENAENEIMHDPLAVTTEIKGDKYHTEPSPSVLNSEACIKTEPTSEKEENVLENQKHNLHGSSLLESNNQYQLLVVNEAGRRVKKFICNDCNKLFRYKSELDKHLRVHTNKKPFECGVCKKSFTQKGNLTNHMLIHSGEKTHICDICNKVFSRKSYLNSHNLIHIGAKPFPCNECDKSFRQKQDLIRHTRIHTGEKPYACEFCEKTFTDDSNLVTHRRIHTGEKPFSCDICYKSFTQRAALNKHKKIHTF